MYKRLAAGKNFRIVASMSNKELMTPDDFNAFARTIRRIADGYADVAREMRETGLSEIEVGGIETARDVLVPRLQGNLGQVNKALTKSPKQLAKVAESKASYRKKRGKG